MSSMDGQYSVSKWDGALWVLSTDRLRSMLGLDGDSWISTMDGQYSVWKLDEVLWVSSLMDKRCLLLELYGDASVLSIPGRLLGWELDVAV